MNAVFDILVSAARKRAAFPRTAAELRAMPLDVAHDLDMDPMAARQTARRAVYGA